MPNNRNMVFYSGLIILSAGAICAIHINLQALLFLHKIEVTYGAWATVYNAWLGKNCAAICLGVTSLGSAASVSPLHTSYIDKLKHWNLQDLKKLLAGMILGGGTVYTDKSSYKYCARYYGKDITLHTIFCCLVRRTYQINSKPTRLKMKNSYVTQVYSKRLVEDLLSLSPSYNIRNGNGHSEINCNDTELPNARFLVESDYEIIRESIRLISSSNGSANYIIERKYNNHNYFIKPRFALGYLSPPQLLDDYRQILEQVGIQTFKVFDKRFGMRGFLLNNSWGGLKIFDKIGGFIDGAKINSGRYKGIERNVLLSGLLSFHRLENNDFPTREEATLTVENYIPSETKPEMFDYEQPNQIAYNIALN